MIRVLNFLCVALMGVSILALYHVAEQTRVAGARLSAVEARIADEQSKSSELQAQYVQWSNPERIQQLAENSLGMTDKATVQLSSMQMLPQREAQQDQVSEASAAGETPALVKISARTGM
jgi:cell division protein FtsL